MVISNSLSKTQNSTNANKKKYQPKHPIKYSTAHCLKKRRVKQYFGFLSPVARQTDPEAAAEDIQLVAVSDGDRPEGAGAPRRDLRHHGPRHPRQSGQTQCELSIADAFTQLFFGSSPTSLLFSVPQQYVSALRPPKKRHQSSAGMSIDSDMDLDTSCRHKSFLRQNSLAFLKPINRESFQNRSLQDFSDRLKVSAVEEVEISGRRRSILDKDINPPENERTAAASSESLNSLTVVDEWKQVMLESRGVGSHADFIIISKNQQCLCCCFHMTAALF